MADDENFDCKRVCTVSPVRESESDRRIQKLEECIENQKQEIQQLKDSAPFSQPSQASGYVGCPPNSWNSATACPAPTSGYETAYGSWAGGPSPPARAGRPTGWYAADDTRRPAPTQQPHGSGHYSQYYATSNAARGEASSRRRPGNNRLPRDVSSRCLERGHWRAQCLVAGYRPTPGGWYGSGYVTAPADQPTSGYETAGDNRSNAPRPPNYGNVHVLSDTYIEISNRGRQSFALLDTGCEQSVCPLRLCRKYYTCTFQDPRRSNVC